MSLPERAQPALILLFGCTAVSACAQPQTPAEFKAVVQGGAFRARMEEFTVARTFEQVVKDVRERAERGWNYTHREVNMVGAYPEPYAETLRCGSTVQADRADVFVQFVPRPRGIGPHMPEGGWYTLVVEIRPISDRETGVKTFGTSVSDAAFEVIHKWAEGTDAPAPRVRR